MNGSGDRLAVWEDTRPGEQAIVGAASSSPGRNFLISDRAGGKAAFPVLAAGAGIVAVAYETGGGVRIRVFGGEGKGEFIPAARPR